MAHRNLLRDVSVPSESNAVRGGRVRAVSGPGGGGENPKQQPNADDDGRPVGIGIGAQSESYAVHRGDQARCVDSHAPTFGPLAGMSH